MFFYFWIPGSSAWLLRVNSRSRNGGIENLGEVREKVFENEFILLIYIYIYI